MGSRQVPIDELVTVDDIATILNVSVNVASNIVRGRDGKKRLKFPQPLVGKGTHAVWLKADVMEWHRERMAREAERAKNHVEAHEYPFKQPSWAAGRAS